MIRFRYSIAGFMAVSALLALGFAALSHPSAWWASGLFTLDVALIGASAVVGLVGRGRGRGFGAGFAVLGGIYLILVFGRAFYQQPYSQSYQPLGHGVTAPPLLTQAVVDWLMPRGDRQVMYVDTAPAGEGILDMPPSAYVAPGTRPTARRVVNWLQYRRIAHALFALAFASLGGLVGLWASGPDGR